MIFIDTSAWIAFANELDMFYEHAQPLMVKILKDKSVKLFTSDVVLGEILDKVSHKNYKRRLIEESGLSEENIEKKCKTIRDMLDRIIQDTAKAELLHADEKIIADTKILYRRNPNIRLNFSDWSNISFMKRDSIKKLFTYDGGFGYVFRKGFEETTDFETIPPFDELTKIIKSKQAEQAEKTPDDGVDSAAKDSLILKPKE